MNDAIAYSLLTISFLLGTLFGWSLSKLPKHKTVKSKKSKSMGLKYLEERNSLFTNTNTVAMIPPTPVQLYMEPDHRTFPSVPSSSVSKKTVNFPNTPTTYVQEAV